MNAIVLAGGFGSRLRPLTDETPKPALKVAGRPTLDYVVSQLRFYGVSDVVFTLGYRAEQIRALCEGYADLRRRYTVERVPLGTAGAVKAAEKSLDDVFLVLSGDCLSNIDLGKMIAKHLASPYSVTISLTSVADPRRYGVATLDGDGVRGFVEKPSDCRYGRLVSTGVYAVDKSVLNEVESGVATDFARDLFPRLVERGEVGAFVHDGYWCDIGDKRSYYEANFFMADGGFYPFIRSATVPPVKRDGCLLGRNATVVGSAKNCVVGEGSVVASCAEIRDCVVGDGVIVRGVHYGEIIGNGFVEKCRLSERFARLPDGFLRPALDGV